MIRLYDFDEVRPEEILNRDIRAEANVEAAVDAIIADVRARGDAALIDYAGGVFLPQHNAGTVGHNKIFVQLLLAALYFSYSRFVAGRSGVLVRL